MSNQSTEKSCRCESCQCSARANDQRSCPCEPSCDCAPTCECAGCGCSSKR